MATISSIDSKAGELVEQCECKICHLSFNTSEIASHEKVCESIFNQCKEEYTRRGLGMTDEDIVDLLAGKVPAHAIQLERCQICGKKILPKLLCQHKEQCEIKSRNQTLNVQAKVPQEIVQKSDYKENHAQLIERLRNDRREAKKNF